MNILSIGITITLSIIGFLIGSLLATVNNSDKPKLLLIFVMIILYSFLKNCEV